MTVFRFLLSLSLLLSVSGYICYRPVRKICTRENGNSAVGTFWLEVNGTQSDIGVVSQVFPLDGMKLRYTTPDYDSPQHVAPRKQYITNLDASHMVITSEGQVVIFEQGELFYVEDLTGVGHISRSYKNQSRHSMFLIVDPDYDTGACINATQPAGSTKCP
eukprot:TRINITY_DN19535_c0_g1_i1.p1 TRINITY_DN19535_c0_g1~~TRINITY_DN19535_c0_g1_i1.p1  ORF type:complete len:179 (+),score=28.28 TRINITY_DN19535_c0_g1_i1:57-539(+)